jgi:hypothetical protein
MPRTFPSQIVAYLAASFKKPEEASTPSNSGKLAGFLALYDRLPHELIRLSEQDYATLIAAVETIRFNLDRFRHAAPNVKWKDVAAALQNAWQKIAILQDEAPSTAHDLSFVSDQLLREMIGLDIAAVSTDLQNGEWKGATIISGSCCEALLLYGLQVTEGKTAGSVSSAVTSISWPKKKTPNAADLTDMSWDLFSFTEVAAQIRIIRSETQKALHIARGYRNLIHPAKSVREQVTCDRGTAYIAVGALEHLVSDLRRYF